MVICVIYRSRTISRRYREPLRSHQHTAQVVVRRCCCSSNDDAVAGLSSSSRIHDRFGLRKDGTFRVRRVVIQEENKNIINTHTKVSTVLVSFEKRWLVKSQHAASIHQRGNFFLTRHLLAQSRKYHRLCLTRLIIRYYTAQHTEKKKRRVRTRSITN